MNSNSNPKTTQASTSQDTHVLTNTASKTEMLQRIEQAYQLSNQVYERIGKLVDILYDKRSAIEAFQATDEISTAEVDQIFQALSKALEMIEQDLSWVPDDE